MKKIILAAAILIITAGILSTNVKSIKITKTAAAVENDILATAD